jgi:predicted nuclease with RNAse H fold
VGVDLAAEPKKTAVAIVDWYDGRAVVQSVKVGCADPYILEVATGATKVGIDCPLGWPEPFIDFVIAQRDELALPATDLAGRRRLAYRETDRAVTAATGLRPLSVAADRIGHAAMRAAGLLAMLASAGHSVDRSGVSGLVVEAYPAAALKGWTLTHLKYKGAGSITARAALVEALQIAMPELELGSAAELCREDDDAFDAVVCALIARAAVLGDVTAPDDGQAALARTEGWIAVPTCSLRDLTA